VYKSVSNEIMFGVKACGKMQIEKLEIQKMNRNMKKKVFLSTAVLTSLVLRKILTNGE